MTNQDLNLKVLTDHLTELAEKQRSAGGGIAIAKTSVPDGLTGKILKTHGVICAGTSLAMASTETARTNGFDRQHKMSQHLAESLTAAAENYNNADFREGRNIGACAV